MVLFEKNENNNVLIYNFMINDELVRKYREKQMILIPEERRFFDARTCVKEENLRWSTNAGLPECPLFELYGDKIDEMVFPYNKVHGRYDGNYHLLNVSSSREEEKAKVLNEYYCGLLEDRNVVAVQDEEVKRYFLLYNKSYDKVNSDDPVVNARKRVMKNIIEIPESLYLLQMLLKSKYHLIEGYDISEQLKLFNTVSREEIPMDELTSSVDYSVDSINSKINRDQHVLKLMKKLKNC